MGINFEKFVNAFKEKIDTSSVGKSSEAKESSSSNVEKESFEEQIASAFNGVFSEDNMNEIQEEFLSLIEKLQSNRKEPINEENYSDMTLATLYEKLSQATSPEEKAQISAEIQALEYKNETTKPIYENTISSEQKKIKEEVINIETSEEYLRNNLKDNLL